MRAAGPRPPGRARQTRGVDFPYAERIEPTLPQLRAFAAVADELHFGRAALALGLSQPQVSRQVASLERSLGVTLLRRTPRHVALTPAGAELVAGAREALEAIERVKRRARAAARGALGSVSVGFVWSTLPAYLPALVAAAGARHPQVELTVSQMRLADIVGTLRRGDVDLVITRGHLGESEMIVETLNAEPSVVAIPAAHPLARREVIDQADLHGEPLISLSRETIPYSFDIVRARLEEQGIRPSEYRPASSPPEALALVAAGLGIYYRMPITAAMPQSGVVFREVRDVPMRTLLARRPEPPPPAIGAVIALAVALFNDVPSASNHALTDVEEPLPSP
jgi:DNA-binding transcriptional LysR family regulator